MLDIVLFQHRNSKQLVDTVLYNMYNERTPCSIAHIPFVGIGYTTPLTTACTMHKQLLHLLQGEKRISETRDILVFPREGGVVWREGEEKPVRIHSNIFLL